MAHLCNACPKQGFMRGNIVKCLRGVVPDKQLFGDVSETKNTRDHHHEIQQTGDS